MIAPTKIFRRSLLVGGALLLVAALSACSESPAGPSPQPQPPPGPTPPPTVTAPVIRAVTAAVVRTEVDTDIAVTAEVEDAEKPPTALTYLWTANVGTIAGTGGSVNWRLARGAAATPVDVVITLTVVEPYQVLQNGQLVDREHRVSRQAAPFRVHDSETEVTDMTLHFLVDLFGNSNVSPDACLVDFSDTCPGKNEERQDIIDNRQERIILSVEAAVDSVHFNDVMTTAEVRASCRFSDKDRLTGELFSSRGTCYLEAVYHDDRWWLCVSNYRDRVVLPQFLNTPGSTVADYWRSGVSR